MRAIFILTGMFVLAGMAAAGGDVLLGQDAAVKEAHDGIVIEGAADFVPVLSPITWTGSTCSSYREWSALPYIYRYCSSSSVAGYEAQRDDFYRTTSIRYRGSKLVDCASTEGWLPANGTMKSFYC